MIQQCISFSKNELDLVNLEEFQTTVDHLHSLTPVVIDISASIEELVSQPLELCIKQLVRPSIDAVLGVQASKHGSWALSLLDSGVPLVFYFHEEVGDINEQEFFASIPRSRSGLVVDWNSASCSNVLAKYRSSVGHFIVRMSKENQPSGGIDAFLAEILGVLKSVDYSIEVYIQASGGVFDSAAFNKAATSHEHLHLLLEPSLKASRLESVPKLIPYVAITNEQDSDLLDLFIGTIRTDRADGLFTTVVCDEHHRCLGLVYSNTNSVEIAFLKRRGVYYSRSRSGLWHKGESSGMVQELIAMRLDCDRDALKFTVKQLGDPPAFCHLMTRSCWGEQNGLYKLQHILQQRKENAPAGSYTQKLFNDSNLLRQKLLEEVQELVEAEDKDHIASEAADVMYFMMTRCIAAGVTLQDMERYLDLRSMKINRRPGLAKEWRTLEAEKALQKNIEK